jgi:hypothetical protein
MAKKRAARKSAPSTPPAAPPDEAAVPRDVSGDCHDYQASATPPAPPHETAVSLAWPVASVVNLESLIVEEFQTKRTLGGYSPVDPIAVNLETGAIGIARDLVQKKLIIKIHMTVRATKQDAPVNSEPSLRIECHFVLIYSIPSFEGLADDQFAAFAQTSGLFNLWPFWRQIVHTTTLHLGLPPIILPTHRVG